MHLLLAGNPNCGKTTLFNALTGQQQSIGNWPGVTVEKKQGLLSVQGVTHTVTDLPGVYSMLRLGLTSVDEQIAAEVIHSIDYDVIVNVVDACYLERHLYLTSQLLELGKPVVVALNMTDLAVSQGIHINPRALEQALGCPVVPIQAHKQAGVSELQKTFLSNLHPAKPLSLPFSESLQPAFAETLKAVQAQSSVNPVYQAHRTLEGDRRFISEDHALAERLQAIESDVLAADARYTAVHAITAKTQHKQSDASEGFTAKLDRLVLHRVFALPIFFAMMYGMFLFAINIGGAFQDFFDLSSQALFVKAPARLLASVHAPSWLIALIAHGVGKGLNTTITFIPVLAAMYLFLSFMEASGYMARAAFVVDRAMRWMGLPGKSFVPMIVGFGCNVPAIMAARTLNNPRERLLTILMSPFMSCSARLAIYAVFVAAFFPRGGQNVVFSLYLIGICMAVLTGLLLRKTYLQGEVTPLILELPLYHRPSFRRLLKDMQRRLKHFLIRAGRLIVPICVLLGGLNSINLSGGLEAGTSETLLAYLGKILTPLFTPMGIQSENWPATVGLLTGTLAKEVVVGTLNALYAQTTDAVGAVGGGWSLWAALLEAWRTIPENIAHLGGALINPVLASAPQDEVSQSMYGVMAQQFSGKASAYAYLLFVLLYVPCVSTMAAIRQEASRGWMWFSIVWSTLLAYSSAVIFYQMATFARAPVTASVWCLSMAALLFGFVLYLRMRSQGERNVTSPV